MGPDVYLHFFAISSEGCKFADFAAVRMAPDAFPQAWYL